MHKTKYLKVHPQHPEKASIDRAAALIKAGELVAFPTETVYGLGADALNDSAVQKIFTAKERPQESPLLIHVSQRQQVEGLALDIPPIAIQLMDHFWPGPLSIILPAAPVVPSSVRGGKKTVGFRMPSHPVSIALIQAAGPIAAPSANLYGRPSPTSSLHVRSDLDGRIAAVLDAGETGGGLESTVLDLSEGRCNLLRQGGIPIKWIQDELGADVRVTLATGMKTAPYKTAVQVLMSENEEDFGEKLQAIKKNKASLGLIHFTMEALGESENLQQYTLDLSGHGRSFYAILRDAEQKGIQVLLCRPIEGQRGEMSAAVVDRITRAASAYEIKGLAKKND
ncbi:MAG: L-threonylcarbamoyladenylate synthase [Bacillota bacterium]|nr:L-threonylcarbamoyladenylate synthase [Bacillota bacterium]